MQRLPGRPASPEWRTTLKKGFRQVSSTPEHASLSASLAAGGPHQGRPWLLGARIASSRSMPFAAVRSLADRFAENALGPHRRFTVTYASVRTLSSAVADEPISSNDFNAFLRSFPRIS